MNELIKLIAVFFCIWVFEYVFAFWTYAFGGIIDIIKDIIKLK